MLALRDIRHISRPVMRAATGAVAAMLATAMLVPAGPAAAAEPARAEQLRLVGERGYEVRLDGAPDGLEDDLQNISQLIARKSEPPASIGGLRRRAQSDVRRMNKVLQSRGYFEGTVAYEIDTGADLLRQTAGRSAGTVNVADAGARAGNDTVVPGAPAATLSAAQPASAGPVDVVVTIVPGPQYEMGKAVIAYRDTALPDDAAPDGVPTDLAEFGVLPGQPAVAADILKAEKTLINDLQDRGFPFAKSAGRKALADVDTDTLSVTSFVSLGARARFGALNIKGLERVTPDYIVRRKTFGTGDEFDQQQLDDMRAGLVRSGLFDGVRFSVGDAVNADGEVPVTLTVSERPPRTIGAGADYSSTEGFGINAHWENRNLLGEGQHLRLELRLAQIEQELQARYRVAGFRRPDQILELGTLLGRESTDVYDRTGGLLTAGIERPLGDRWTGRAGVVFDAAQVDEVGEASETALLFGVPLQASYDAADSLIDPSEGYRVKLGTTPYVGRFNDELAFHVADAELRTYVPLDEDKTLIWAARARAGSILGARTGELPADKRFYSGGAGSVRGFEFQEISPLGEDGTQEGGRSLVELSNEVRWRFMGDFGVVPFVDAGVVTDSPLPDFKEEIAWGGGLGFRYYTSFGPIGIDFAYPISTPSDEEPSLKFYVKLGQAF